MPRMFHRRKVISVKSRFLTNPENFLSAQPRVSHQVSRTESCQKPKPSRMNVIHAPLERGDKTTQDAVVSIVSCMAYISSFCLLKVEREPLLCARYRPTLTKRKHQCKRVKWTPFCTIFRPFDRANDALSIGVHLVRFFLRFSCFHPLVSEDDGAAAVAGWNFCVNSFPKSPQEPRLDGAQVHGHPRKTPLLQRYGRVSRPFSLKYRSSKSVCSAGT